jgi:hypothetical protein
MRLLRFLKVMLIAGTLAASSAAITATGVLAYGKADQPLAQIEFSGNCNDPTFGLCQQVGLGGVWLWIEIDQGGTADVAGAFCGHVRGVGGGAFPVRGEFDWVYGTAADAATAGAFVVGVDPNDWYYLLTLGPGQVFAFPTTVGHYSFHPVPAVTIQLQVAP